MDPALAYFEAMWDRLVAEGLNEPLEDLIADHPYSLEKRLNEMIAAGADEPIDTLIVNLPYLVFIVERRGREIFALLGYDILDNFNLIRIPQRLHEPFEQLLFLSRLNGRITCIVEYTRNVNNGKPTFMVNGGGFSTYI